MKCDSVRGRDREEQREIEGQLLGIMGKDQAGIKVTGGPGFLLSGVGSLWWVYTCSLSNSLSFCMFKYEPTGLPPRGSMGHVVILIHFSPHNLCLVTRSKVSVSDTEATKHPGASPE